ncbi:MAG: acetylglutamate kinase [Rikenellaceae bacterium]
MKKVRIIKVGGNIIDNPQALEAFLGEFAQVEGMKILVHGGGKIATAVAKGLGIEAQMIDGRRVTDAPMLRVVTMVYAGLINKEVVVKLRGEGCNAIGLTGADGGLIQSKKRSATPIDFGYVGDPTEVNLETATTLLEGGLVPIIAPLTLGDAELLNTNADTVAQTIATGLAAKYEVTLEFRFEKAGVLLDINDPSSLVKEITAQKFEELKQCGAVAQGMIPKITNALQAVEQGVESVYIGGTLVCATK